MSITHSTFGVMNDDRLQTDAHAAPQTNEPQKVQRTHLESELRLRNRANNFRAMLWVTDENQRCTFLSQSWSEFTGQTEGGGYTLSWTNAVHPDDHERCRHFYEHLLFLADGECDSFDHRVVRPDGTSRWVRLHVKPVYTGSSNKRKITHVIGTIIDITQQRELEQSLDEARAQAILDKDSKREFLAYMSHEIRTPLTAILGYAELLRAHIGDKEAIRHLNTIRRNGDYLLGIINDILDLSKIEADKLELHRERFDPSQLVEDIYNIMAVRASEKGLHLEVLYEGKIPSMIESDPKRLKQILINLVDNAIKFTKQGVVKVVIDYKSDDPKFMREVAGGAKTRSSVRLVESGVLRFRVIDFGIGMSDEHLTKLFQPFEQGDSSISRQFGGTGLGLAISQRLVEMLGGNIEVDSELAKGSTFEFAIATNGIPEAMMVDHGPVKGSLNQSESSMQRARSSHIAESQD